MKKFTIISNGWLFMYCLVCYLLSYIYTHPITCITFYAWTHCMNYTYLPNLC